MTSEADNTGTFLKGCISLRLRGWLFTMGFVGIYLLLLVVLVVPLGFAGMLFGLDSQLAFPIGFAIANFVGLGAALGGIIIWRSRRDRGFDDAFAQYGMKGRAYQVGGRRFDGQIEEWPAEAFYYRGPIFELHLLGEFGSEITIGLQNVIAREAARILEREPLAVDDPGLQKMIIHAEDRAWARAVVTDPRFREPLQALVNNSGPGWPILMVQADRLVLQVSKVTWDQVKAQLGRWIPLHLDLARRLRELPAPTVRSEPRHLSQKIRSGPWSSPWVILGTAFAAVALIVVCTLAATGAVIFLTTS